MALLLATCSVLSACGTTTPPVIGPDGTPIKAAQTSTTDQVLYGEVHDSLSSIEGQYKSDSDDPVVAVRYAKALRESGDLKGAKSVLLPLAKNDKVGTFANMELSAVYLSEGKFDSSEDAARRAIKFDNLNYRAWRNLGNALDAQEKYKEGESAFRRSLELWGTEDKVPVMNNLALNLAAQGYTDRALTMLYDAQKIDPSRVEIERNIRIIRTLNEPIAFNGEKKPFPKTKVPD